MKVLHIPNYYNPHIGGIEKVSENVIDSLKGDYEQKVICFKDAKKTTYDNVNGIDVIRVGCITKVASQSIAPKYKKELRKVMIEFKPDIVVFHYPNPYVAHYLMKYLKGDFKLVLYWHLDITKQKFLSKFFVGQTKALLERADKVIATSPNYVKGSKFLTEYETKVKVIPNCIDDNVLNISDEEILESNKIREENKGKTIVFGFGRHVPYKGLIHLVNASKHLGEDYKIFIGGEGEETKALKKAALGDNKVVFLGRLSRSEVKEYAYACDIFAFPSITKNEAFGIGLAEVMSYKKPAVTFNIPGSGVNFVSLDKITGIEVPNSDDLKYAEAIKELGSNEKLREEYGKNAKKRVDELFMFNSFKENITDLFKDLK